ncbi:MAG: NAD(P)/FAD-dependent oxidoreductase [Saprospiraceae bacterium]
MAKKFDVIVIGSGPSSGQVISQLLKTDKSIASIDYHYGGTCALRGCTPKKAMENITTQVWMAKAAQGSGFPSFSGEAIWEQLVTHQRRFTELVTANNKEQWREQGVTVIEGKARFTGKKTLAVGEDRYQAKHIVIAAGAKPRSLDIDGADLMLTSADFFNLQKLPRSIVFAGGGYIAFELAHIAAAAGSKVTILSSEDKPLGMFDPDLVSQLIQSALAKGIDIQLGKKVIGVHRRGDKYMVVSENASTEAKSTLVANGVFNTTGRVPNIASLDLEKADIEHDDSGIEVNEYLQTTNKNVYAVGDIIGRYPLTPVAGLEGKKAAQNIIKAKSAKMEYMCVPTALYTYPKLASVGKSEKELLEKGIEYQKKQGSTRDWLTEKSINNHYAGYKILLSEDGEEILGAHLMGSHAHDVINIFALAIQMDIPCSKIDNAIFAYPTAMSDVQSMLS